jgi:hypothetical protein
MRSKYTPEEKTKLVFLSLNQKEYSRSYELLNYNYPNFIESKFRHIRSDSKFIEVFKVVIEFRKSNAVFIVCSPSHALVPLIRILSRKRIVLDAGWPLSDGNLSRENQGVLYHRFFKNYLTDWIAFRFADRVLVESKIQRRRISRNFRIRIDKFFVRYTGFSNWGFKSRGKINVDVERILQTDERQILFLFRGKYNNESGINKILDAFSEIDTRYQLILLSNFVPSNPLPVNAVHISRYLNHSELELLYRKVDISIGQLGNSPRTQYSIPHKAFESAYYGVPYISKDSPALREFFSNSPGVKYIDVVNTSLSVQLIEAAADSKFRESGRSLRKTLEKINSEEEILDALLR